jgi:hypothetical protein
MTDIRWLLLLILVWCTSMGLGWLTYVLLSN